MPVDLQSYRPWSGRARPTPLTVFAIAITMIRRIGRWKLVRWIISFVVLSACIASTLFHALRVMGRDNPMLDAALTAAGIGLGRANLVFQAQVPFWCMVVAALAGAPMIAEDRRAGALALYFSRPIRHATYVLGKFLALAFFLGALLVLPVVMMYAADVGLSEPGQGADLSMLGRTLVPSMLALAVSAAIALGVSSLVRRTGIATCITLGLFLAVSVLSVVLAEEILDDPSWFALNPFASTQRIAIDLIQVPELPRQLNDDVSELPLSYAWYSVGAWTAAGFGVLVARIRNVEVVG